MRSEPEHLLTAVETFLATCRNPALLEYGEDIVLLRPGEFALEIRSERLWIEAWSETRSISRRILTIERQTTGVLECSIHRFGGAPGKLNFLDLDRPQTAHKTLSGIRQNFAEVFRRMLHRQFPGWEITALSCGMDLQRSFSSIFPRARLSRGNRQIAALACASVEDESPMLSFALIWHHYIQSHSQPGTHTPLCLFLPEAGGILTAQRVRMLRHESLEPRMFRFNRHGSAGEVDAADLGNLATRVSAGANERCAKFTSRWSADAGSERWFEAAVRSHIQLIDPGVLQAPVHGQVFTLAGRDRDLIDLLAVTSSGRLVVLELKVSEDLHLPLQALDYWMRIRWHAQAAELDHLFPGVSITSEAPRLLLVAPANSFHPSNAAVLSYFSPEIEVERIGIGSDWQRKFKVVLRLSGADDPISHRSSFISQSAGRIRPGGTARREHTGAERSTREQNDDA